MSILDYLVSKSKVAKELDSPTLEELLTPYCSTRGPEAISRLAKLLECFPTLETEPLKISNCMLDGTLPYDSLIGLPLEDIKELTALADYLYLPTVLSDKLRFVLKKSKTGWTDLYEPLEFIKNGDIRGIKHICDTLDKFHVEYITVKDDKYAFNMAAQIAAFNGQLNMLKWLHKRLVCNYWQACERAAAGGHLKCLKWLVGRCLYGKVPSGCMFIDAARGGHLECLKYLHSRGFKFRLEIDYAAEAGQFHCVQFLYEIGTPMSKKVFSSTASIGNIEHLQWLREKGCPYDLELCAEAARSGHLNCLIWLHEQGYPWYVHTTSILAEKGYLEHLKYAYTHGCSWSEYTCMYALDYDKLDCLKYAIENGCPIGSYINLRGFRPTASLKYLYENGHLASYKDHVEKVLGIV